MVALAVAIVLGLINTFVRPILIFVTFPLTIITLGLFILVINTLLILLAAAIVPGFAVDGFFWALLFGIVLWLVNSVLQAVESKLLGD
jgi:putative membrane protein